MTFVFSFRFALCPTCVEIQENWHKAKTDGTRELWRQTREAHYNDVGIWSIFMLTKTCYECSSSKTPFSWKFRSKFVAVPTITALRNQLILKIPYHWLSMGAILVRLACLTSMSLTNLLLRVGN
jgi:hypothetical protein